MNREELKAALEKLVFPPFVLLNIVGLDGTRFGVKFGTAYYCSTIEWWSDAPDEWRALEAWHGMARTAFESRLPPSKCLIEAAR